MIDYNSLRIEETIAKGIIMSIVSYVLIYVYTQAGLSYSEH